MRAERRPGPAEIADRSNARFREIGDLIRCHLGEVKAQEHSEADPDSTSPTIRRMCGSPGSTSARRCSRFAANEQETWVDTSSYEIATRALWLCDS
jgi:hypothetical protein